MTDPVARAAPSRRLATIAAARLVAQLIGLTWFVLAAHELSVRDLGILSSGLVAVGVVGLLGNLGATWSIARHVGADPTTAWPAYVRGTRLRVLGGVVAGVGATLVALLLGDDVVWWAIALGSGIALAAGCTDGGFEAMRALGHAREEAAVLVSERALFLVVGGTALAAGAGPGSLLLIYLVTNLISASLMGVAVYRHRGEVLTPAGPFWDAEARQAASAWTLLGLGPRVNSTLFTLLATPALLAGYTIASRPAEAVALLVVGVTTPLVTIFRRMTVRAGADQVGDAGGAATAAVLAVLAAATAWFIVRPEDVIELLAGQDRYRAAEGALRVIAPASALWAMRLTSQLVFVAEERSGLVVRITCTGLVVNTVLGIALISEHGLMGGAVALLVAELAAAVVLLVAAPWLRRGRFLRQLGPGAAISAVTALVLQSTSSLAPALVVVAAGSSAGAWAAHRLLRSVDAIDALNPSEHPERA